MRNKINEHDLVGYKIGVIEVIGLGYMSDKGKRMMECKCHRCGNIFYQSKHNIAYRLKGCSCKNCLNKNRTTHGMKNTKIYKIWLQMKHRCNGKTDYNHWKNYGGRGIRVCDEWDKSFESFYDWAIANGWNENNLYSSGRNMLTIDRTDNDKGYCPENCRIITHKENQYNKRTTIKIEYKGKLYNILELSRMLNLPVTTIKTRVYRNKPIDAPYHSKHKEGEKDNV